MNQDALSSLAARVYLLGFDRERQRLGRGGRGGWRRDTCAAAALADMWLGGSLVTDDRHVAVADARPPADPVLRELWQRIREDRPRTWAWWVRHARVETPVRDQLVAAGAVRVARERRLLLPARIELRDTRAHGRLAATVASTVRGPSPVDRLDPRDTTLVALLAVGEIRTALSRDRRREHAKRIAAMTARGGPALPALRSVIQAAKSSS